MCIHKDDFTGCSSRWPADGIIMRDPIFETGASGLFHTIMDRFGPRMDKWATTYRQFASPRRSRRGRQVQSLTRASSARASRRSYIGIGGSDWGTHRPVRPRHPVDDPHLEGHRQRVGALVKRALLDDKVVARAHQIGVNLARAAKDASTPPARAPRASARTATPMTSTWSQHGQAICSTRSGLQGPRERGGQQVEGQYRHDECCDERGLFRAHDTAERQADAVRTLAYGR